VGGFAVVDVEWVHLAQDRDRWQVLVNTMKNRWVLALWSYTDCIDLLKVSVKFFTEYVPAKCKRLRKSYM
jgi:hypothetical protein